MPWVKRDGASKVVASFARQQPGIADEFLADDHADFLAFRSRGLQTTTGLGRYVISAKSGVAMNADGTFVNIFKTGG